MNVAMLSGRLGKDPELTFAPGSGTAICKFSIAVDRPMKKGETDFINCISFGKTAETIAQHFSKGNGIELVGQIQTGSYTAKDGTKRYTTDVIVNRFEFPKGNKNSGTKNNQSNNDFADDVAPVDDSDMPF